MRAVCNGRSNDHILLAGVSKQYDIKSGQQNHVERSASVGGDLTQADEWTTSLLTNPEVIEVNQHSTKNHPVISNSDRSIWVAQSTNRKDFYVAVFNLKDSEEEIAYPWQTLDISAGQHKVRNLWLRKDLGPMDSLRVKLPPHSSVLYTVAPVQ